MIRHKQYQNDEFWDLSLYFSDNNKNWQKKSLEETTTDECEDSINTKKKSFENDFRKKFKTEKCKFWEINQMCKFGDKVYLIHNNKCAFAHGNEEIKERCLVASNYKTKKCKQFFECGFCNYGTRCQFSHNNK